MKTVCRLLMPILFIVMPLKFGQAYERVAAFVWFDLGNVLIETRNGFNQLHWMPGAVEQIQQLKQRGFRIGLISNIPESWGQPGDRPSKIRQLQEVINQGWIDEQPFDLAVFDQVLVPVYQVEAKPAAKLFKEALQISHLEGRSGFFQGESNGEVEAALNSGMAAHLIVYQPDGKTPKYYPIDELPR